MNFQTTVPSTSGFLCNYEEVEIEKPSDGSNGNCIVHYGSAHRNYKMHVNIRSGVREGEAIITKSNIPHLSMNYIHGSLNGTVSRLNSDNMVVMSGWLVNGEESGIFQEFDKKGNCIWRGYYRNGKRYSSIVKSERVKGYYEERTVTTGTLLNIAQYDQDLRNKDGLCMEFANGEWICDCVFEKGVRKRVIQEYRDGLLVRYDEEARGTSAMEWELVVMALSRCINPDSVIAADNSFFVYDIQTKYLYGFVQHDSKFFIHDRIKEIDRVVVVDVKRREMMVFLNSARINLSFEQGIVDLDVTGRRWDGSVMEGKPFGYGTLYDEEGRKEYEGFVLDGVKTGYGKEYYSDIGSLVFDGCYRNNRRFGKGVLYNRNGDVVFDGLWRDRELSSSIVNATIVDGLTESLEYSRNSFSEVESFLLSWFLYSLKQVVIHEFSFGSIRTVDICGLHQLKTIFIGERAFTYSITWQSIKKSERSDSELRIFNCPKLKSIHLGDYAFSDYHHFGLQNLPSLQSIAIDEKCFYWAQVFSLVSRRNHLYS